MSKNQLLETLEEDEAQIAFLNFKKTFFVILMILVLALFVTVSVGELQKVNPNTLLAIGWFLCGTTWSPFLISIIFILPIEKRLMMFKIDQMFLLKDSENQKIIEKNEKK